MSTLIPMKIKFMVALSALMILTSCSSAEPEPPITPPVVVADVIPFTLAGVDYTLPVLYQTLIDDGWNAVDAVEGNLAAHTVQKDVYMRKGTNLIIVSLHNNTEVEIEKKASLIAGIEAENRTSVNGRDQPVDIQIHDGINFETDEASIAAQFEAVATSENNVYRILTIQHNKLMKTEFKYKHDSGAMRWIIIENFK